MMVERDPDLDALRRRSDESGVQAGAESIDVHREILRRVPTDPIASNRLGIVLLGLRQYDEAEAVLSPAPKPVRPPPRSRPTTYWINALHYHDDDWTIEVGEETWISDV